jgi:hypothetical protein
LHRQSTNWPPSLIKVNNICTKNPHNGNFKSATNLERTAVFSLHAESRERANFVGTRRGLRQITKRDARRRERSQMERLVPITRSRQREMSPRRVNNITLWLQLRSCARQIACVSSARRIYIISARSGARGALLLYE